MAKKKESKFKGRVADDAQKQKQSGSSYGYLQLPKNIKVYSPTPGQRESFDIIPYTVIEKQHPDKIEKGEEWYKRPFKTHRGIGADNDAVVCLQSFGEKCPICDYRKKRASEGADKDELKQFNATNRNLYYLIPKGIKKLEEVPHIFDFSQFLFQDQLNDEILENEDYQVFPDTEEGLTLKVRWSEEVFAGNKYAKVGRIDFVERKDNYEAGEFSELPDLASLLTRLSYDELNAKFLEIDHEDEEEDEKPTRNKKSTKPISKVEEDDEEEEEDEKPTRNKKPAPAPAKSKKSAPVEEDEDEEEDEEEEEAPKKSTKPAPKKGGKAPVPVVKITWDDLVEMDLSELIEVAESEGLDVDDYIDEDEDEEVNCSKLRSIIANTLGIEVPQKKVAKRTAKKEEAPAPAPVKSKKPTGKDTPKKELPVCPEGYDIYDDFDLYDECEGCKLKKICEKGLPF